MTMKVFIVAIIFSTVGLGCLGAEDRRLPVNVASAAVIALDDDTLILPIRQGLLKYSISKNTLIKYINLGTDPEIPTNPYISDGEYYRYDRYTEPEFYHYDPNTKELYFSCGFSPKIKYDLGISAKWTYYLADLNTGNVKELDNQTYSHIFASNSFSASFDVGKNYKRVYIYFCATKNRDVIFFDRPILPKYYLKGDINFGLENKGITTKEDQDFRLCHEMILADQKNIFVYGTDSKTNTKAFFHGLIEGDAITFARPLFSWATGRNETNFGIAFDMGAFPGYFINGNLYFMGEGVITGRRKIKTHDPILGMIDDYVIEGGNTIRKYKLGDPPGVTTAIVELAQSYRAYSFYILNDKLYYFKFMGAEKPLGLFVKDLKEQ
jgi:hypothetical protein